MTQQTLAALLGVSVRTVGNWESGATVPKSRMGALEKALGGGGDLFEQRSGH